MKNFYNKGITLLELVVIVAIIGIIVALAIPQFSSLKKTQILKNAGQDIFSTLNKARSETLASLNSSEYGVHFDADKIVLFKGISYSVVNSNNEIINIISPATLSSTFTGGNIYFSRLTGMPNPSAGGTVTVSIDGISQTKIITVSSTGSININ